MAIKLSFEESQALFIAYLQANNTISLAYNDIRFLLESLSALKVRNDCLELFKHCELDDSFAMEYANVLFEKYGNVSKIVYEMASTETKVFLKMKYGDKFE